MLEPSTIPDNWSPNELKASESKFFVCMRCGNSEDNGVTHGYWGELCICCTYDVVDPYKKLSPGSCNIHNCKNCGGPEARNNPPKFEPTGTLVIGDERDKEIYLWKHKDGRTFITRMSYTYEVPSEIFDKLLIGEPTGKARITIRKEHTKRVG